MFSFDDPKFEEFLAEWCRVLLTIPSATAVYYIGASVWVPSDNSPHGFSLIPNFIVRTVDPKWDEAQGMPVGEANHGIVMQASGAELQLHYYNWHQLGWTQSAPIFSSVPVIESPENFIRVIEVPANESWAGPEYLKRIENGVSVPYIHQESLRRYNASEHHLDEPAHYSSVDETDVA